MRLLLCLLGLTVVPAALATSSAAPASPDSKIKEIARQAGAGEPVMLKLTPALKAKISAQAAAFGMAKCEGMFIAYYIDGGSTLIPLSYDWITSKIKKGILESAQEKKMSPQKLVAVSHPFPDVQMLMEVNKVSGYAHTFVRPEQGKYRYYTYICRS